MNKSSKIAMCFALIAAVTAIISSLASAYQSYLLRMNQHNAFTSTLQSARIAACSEALGYIKTSWEDRFLGVHILNENFSDAENAEGLASVFLNSKENHLNEMRNRIVKLQILFPESKVVSDYAVNYSKFYQSYNSHWNTIERAFSAKQAPSDFGFDTREERYQHMLAASVSHGLALSIADTKEIFYELSNGMDDLYELCAQSATVPKSASRN